MKAADVMSAPVRVISPSDTIAHARRLMVRYHISRILIVEEGDLYGILTKKDLAYRLRRSEPAWRRRPIDRIPASVVAVRDPVTITPSTGIREIAGIFVANNFSSVPVVHDGEVVGIVTKSDLMKSGIFRGLTAPVSDVMEDVSTVSRLHSLDHVIDVMSERNDKVVVTENDGSIAGIITETNLAFFAMEERIGGSVPKDAVIRRRRLSRGSPQEGGLSFAPVTAEDIMTFPVQTTDPATPLNRAIGLMNRHRINSLVVVDDKDLTGIIKRDDIIREVAK